MHCFLSSDNPDLVHCTSLQGLELVDNQNANPHLFLTYENLLLLFHLCAAKLKWFIRLIFSLCHHSWMRYSLFPQQLTVDFFWNLNKCKLFPSLFAALFMQITLLHLITTKLHLAPKIFSSSSSPSLVHHVCAEFEYKVKVKSQVKEVWSTGLKLSAHRQWEQVWAVEHGT